MKQLGLVLGVLISNAVMIPLAVGLYWFFRRIRTPALTALTKGYLPKHSLLVGTPYWDKPVRKRFGYFLVFIAYSALVWSVGLYTLDLIFCILYFALYYGG